MIRAFLPSLKVFTDLSLANETHGLLFIAYAVLCNLLSLMSTEIPKHQAI